MMEFVIVKDEKVQIPPNNIQNFHGYYTGSGKYADGTVYPKWHAQISFAMKFKNASDAAEYLRTKLPKEGAYIEYCQEEINND